MCVCAIPSSAAMRGGHDELCASPHSPCEEVVVCASLCTRPPCCMKTSPHFLETWLPMLSHPSSSRPWCNSFYSCPLSCPTGLDALSLPSPSLPTPIRPPLPPTRLAPARPAATCCPLWPTTCPPRRQGETSPQLAASPRALPRSWSCRPRASWRYRSTSRCGVWGSVGGEGGGELAVQIQQQVK